MKLSENIPLAKLTTFRLGGPARGVASCRSVDDLQAALSLARERGLPWYVIGGGSNLLASDAGYDGVIIQIEANSISFDGELAIADAGASWDTLVSESIAHGLWGLENLAGIPGSAGGAPVQNIGAYGADISETLSWVETFNTATNEIRRFANNECEFGYRDSVFKHDSSLIIMRTAFVLAHNGTPRLEYADLKREVASGAQLDSPEKIADAVRRIRAGKFPDLTVSGTAGSFFKNPTVSSETFAVLRAKYPELPAFEASSGVKISLAWVLDHVLNLRGYVEDHVRLFENQPLVIVAERGATARAVDALAREVEQKVFEATGITLEREVRMLE